MTLSADHAYTLGYWLHELQTGNATQVLEGFYGALACGNSNTFSGAEVTEPLTGDNYLTLPHLYSSTQMLRLLRAMLLFQPPFVDGASSSVAHIARGTPRTWLEDGQRQDPLLPLVSDMINVNRQASLLPSRVISIQG